MTSMSWSQVVLTRDEFSGMHSVHLHLPGLSHRPYWVFVWISTRVGSSKSTLNKAPCNVACLCRGTEHQQFSQGSGALIQLKEGRRREGVSVSLSWSLPLLQRMRLFILCMVYTHSPWAPPDHFHYLPGISRFSDSGPSLLGRSSSVLCVVHLFDHSGRTFFSFKYSMYTLGRIL